MEHNIYSKTLVIIPTFNEGEVIGDLVDAIFQRYPGIAILVVDDRTDDGTWEKILLRIKAGKSLYFVQRPARMGMGSAVALGFYFGLARNFDYFITMEGDGSHDPVYIESLLKGIQTHDLVLASRYYEGVRVDGWRFRKLLISKLANIYISYILVKPLWDFTSGYRIYKRKIIKHLIQYPLENGAYMFQVQTVALAYRHKARILEIPFLYRDSKYHPSKLESWERREAIRKVWRYRAPWMEILRHLTYVRKNYLKFVKEYQELLDVSALKPDARFLSSERPRLSVGVMAYNEEKNIARCLDAILRQRGDFKIEEIIVVSSGSTDNTDAIVREYEKKHPVIRLLIQPVRMGKAAAINLFLSEAKGEICVLESGDTYMYDNCLAELVAPFRDPTVGMTGAHPIPTNVPKGIINRIVHIMWDMHHHLASISPKCGELVAFRNIIQKIPTTTAVDEASIEGIILHHGLRLRYCPGAIVFNKGPEKLGDFIKQRKRIAIGHRNLRFTSGHTVSTASTGKILAIMLQTQLKKPIHLVVIPVMIALEALARMQGWLEYYLKEKNPYIWDMISSTKELNTPDDKKEGTESA